MPDASTRVALYLRVSKDDNRQTVENQRHELHAYCERMDYEIVAEYTDRESGRRGKAERRAFARLFEDASKRRFDLVVFWALDRFSREGIRKTIHYLQQLDTLTSTARCEGGDPELTGQAWVDAAAWEQFSALYYDRAAFDDEALHFYGQGTQALSEAERDALRQWNLEF